MSKIKYPILMVIFLLIIGLFLSTTISSLPLPASVDVVEINRILKDIEAHWNDLDTLTTSDYPYDIGLLDAEGNLIYQTSPTQDTSLAHSLKNREVILPIFVDDKFVGSALIDTGLVTDMLHFQKSLAFAVFSTFFIFTFLLLIYVLALYRSIVHPFKKLQYFAQQVASGNLDMPLVMTKRNIFGAFSESFDLMRHELALAKQKEYEANKSKKELVASLSHDIKTPVTGIKLLSELLLATVKEDWVKQKLTTIYDKAEHINLLISDMFYTTLEDLGEFQVSPKENYSSLIHALLLEADYYHKVTLNAIPDCLISVDTLRLAQVINNVIYNAYKYGGESIMVSGHLTSHYLEVSIKDNGSGVSEDDLPLLFNKFYRGENTKEQNGTGLGLYISKQLMGAMDGDLSCFNSPDGFTVLLLIPLI